MNQMNIFNTPDELARLHVTFSVAHLFYMAIVSEVQYLLELSVLMQ